MLPNTYAPRCALGKIVTGTSFTLGNVQVACHLRERFVHRLPRGCRGFERVAVGESRPKKTVKPSELTWTDAARFRYTIEDM